MNSTYKNQLLFRDDQMVRRKIADQLQFEEHFASELPVFDGIFRDAFDQMNDLRSNVGLINVARNWEATVMAGFVQGGLRQTFPHKLQYINGVYHYRDSEYFLVFKKLEKNYMPQNNQTLTSLRRYYQIATKSESPIPIVFVGYKVNQTFTDYNGTFATYSNDLYQPEWITSIESLSENISNIESEDKPMTHGPRVILKNSLKKAE